MLTSPIAWVTIKSMKIGTTTATDSDRNVVVERMGEIVSQHGNAVSIDYQDADQPNCVGDDKEHENRHHHGDGFLDPAQIQDRQADNEQALHADFQISVL